MILEEEHVYSRELGFGCKTEQLDSRTPQLSRESSSYLTGSCPSYDDDSEEDSAELSEIKQAERHKYGLPQSMWGVSYLVIVRDLTGLCVGKMSVVHCARALFSLTILILNLLLQVGLLYWISKFVVAPQEHRIQADYKRYRAEAWTTSGEFNPTGWGELGDEFKERLCQASIAHRWFLAAILLLWTMRMFQELRETIRLTRYTHSLPSLPAGASVDNMILEFNDKDGDLKQEIIALNRLSSIAIVFLVTLPRMAIAICLLLLGSRWLSSTQSFENLILNALALEMLIGIDELLFEFMFPPTMLKTMARIKLAPPKTSDEGSEQNKAEIIGEYHRSIFYLVATLGFVMAYAFFAQAVLPGYTGDLHPYCQDFLNSRYRVQCSLLEAYEEDCFPTGPH